tara:strand:- start:40 stop:342 length:303 start_codon:yes stop_codon:yes gene_type:complete
MNQKELDQSHLMIEMNDLMHKQRLGMIAQYLDHLNDKAAKRRKILEASFLLMDSLKALSGLLPHIPGNSDATIHLPPDEIRRRAKDLQVCTRCTSTVYAL